MTYKVLISDGYQHLWYFVTDDEQSVHLLLC